MTELEKNAEKLAYKWWHSVDKEFVGVIDAYVQGYKDAFNKAYKYFKANYEDIGIRYLRGHEVEDEIEIFKKFMEEQ